MVRLKAVPLYPHQLIPVAISETIHSVKLLKELTSCVSIQERERLKEQRTYGAFVKPVSLPNFAGEAVLGLLMFSLTVAEIILTATIGRSHKQEREFGSAFLLKLLRQACRLIMVNLN